jgi:hypothetical protein
MSAIQEACLNFCVELLNMEIEFSEYESALVRALAVLGVSETGCRDPDSYPPILSAVIKCARFMVVQKAVHKAGPRLRISISREDGRWIWMKIVGTTAIIQPARAHHPGPDQENRHIRAAQP